MSPWACLRGSAAVVTWRCCLGRLLLGGILAAFYLMAALAIRQLATAAVQQPDIAWPNYGWCFGMGSAVLWLLTGLFSCCESADTAPKKLYRHDVLLGHEDAFTSEFSSANACHQPVGVPITYFGSCSPAYMRMPISHLCCRPCEAACQAVRAGSRLAQGVSCAGEAHVPSI